MGARSDPQGLQAPRRGGLPDRRGVTSCRAGEVDSPWASEHTASLVGATAAGVEPSGVVGAALAGSVRSAVPETVQGEGSRAPAAGPGEGWAHRWGFAEGAGQVHRGLREL